VLLFHNDKVISIDIKRSSKPDKAVKIFEVLKNTPYKIDSGGIICLCHDYLPIDENNWYIHDCRERSLRIPFHYNHSAAG
jgi:hypothetical protein